MKLTIAAIILTYNEESNLEKCLKSIRGLVTEIIVIDSHSTDKTVEIAKHYGANVYEHDFTNQAEQFNWALDTTDIKSEWILKLDADEYLLPELADEIKNTLPSAPQEVAGFLMKRRMYFMGRWIRYGGYYPRWFLRLWRKGRGRSEVRKMDEHIILSEGVSKELKNDFVDDNRKGLEDWKAKHRKYAMREAEDVFEGRYGEGAKRNAYYRTPAFLRVFVYFAYRYFLQFGFLDGIIGLIFHSLHGFWYRMLVDVRIFQLYQNKGQKKA